MWKIIKEMGLPDHLTCFLRNLYVGQDATVRTRHGPTHWFQIRKGVCQGCILLPYLFNICAEYIMWNARLVEALAGIKIAGRNVNNLRYADDTTVMAESEEQPQTWLKKTQIYYLTVLEVRSPKWALMRLKSRCWQGWIPSEGSRAELISLPSLACRSYWNSLAYGPWPLQLPASLITSCSASPVSTGPTWII